MRSESHPERNTVWNVHALEWAQCSTTLSLFRLARHKSSHLDCGGLTSSQAESCILQEAPKPSGERGDEQPSWSHNFLSEGHGEGQFDPKLQPRPQQEAGQGPSLEFAEPEFQMFDYISQVCLASALIVSTSFKSVEQRSWAVPGQCFDY